jgi:hypothetical protein
MAQRIATLELVLLQRLPDNRWLFAVKLPNAAFERTMQLLSDSPLFTIRTVTFTLGSGFFEMGRAWDVGDEVMQLLSYQFANWQEMYQRATQTRTFQSPDESFWTQRRQQRMQSEARNTEKDTIEIELTAEEMAVVLEAIDTYVPLLTSPYFGPLGLYKAITLSKLLEKIRPWLLRKALRERLALDISEQPSASRQWTLERLFIEE